MPHPEKILWSKLQKRALDGYKFRRQCSIERYVVDFYCPKAKLVVELDGNSHIGEEACVYDRIRDRYLHELGLIVLRFKNQDVRENLSAVLREIRRYLLPLTKGEGPARSGGRDRV